jgi:DNA-binding IclR family transcriptional regulator
VRRIIDVTETQPFYVSALGRAIVAHLPARRRNHVIKHTQFKPLTPFTVTDATAFRAIVRKVAVDGYAIEMNQAQEEVGCIAAPVFNRGSVMAAVSVTVPLTRMNDERCQKLIPVVQHAAAQLSDIMTHDKKESS